MKNSKQHKMKKLIPFTAKSIALVAVVSLLNTVPSYASGESTKDSEDKTTSIAMFPAMELEDITGEDLGINEDELFGLETGKAVVFDSQNNLVAEGELDGLGQPVSKTLRGVLLNANRLMTYNGVQYFRVD